VASNPRVLGLLEEMLESGTTPEEACRDCPELLPEVRQRWANFCRIDAEVRELLPGIQTCQDAPATVPVPPTADLPQVPSYEVEAVLGRGGVGVVYKARHVALKRTVALKMLAAGHGSPADRVRFRAEAEAVARLQHPNIVQIHEVGEADGLPFLALEFVEGGSLAERLAGRPLPPRDAARLVAALAEAMHLAHSRNLVHRDLKPGNVLLAGAADTPVGQCQPKVTDFGLVRQLDADSAQTAVGIVMGTPSYMAPEQAEGRAHAAGPAADVYALGAILYECLTGRPPFRGATPQEVLEQVRSREPAAPSSLNRQVPRDLETICLKCLRKEPEERYSSARELADDLGRFLRGEPVAARPVGVGERVLKWVRRRPAVAGLLAAVVLLIAAGSVGAALLSQQRASARARQTQIDQDVRGVLERARGLLEDGWQAAELAKLTEARAQANRAEDIAHSGGASALVQTEAEEFREDASGRLERAVKNRSLLDAILDVSAPQETGAYSRAPARHIMELPQPSVDEQYAAAFRRWGLDVDGTSEAEVVARLGAEPDVVVQELIAALDGWMVERRQRKRPAADWRRLFRVADRLDHSERHRQVRALLVGVLPPRPESVATAVAVGSPWLVLWEAARGNAWRHLLQVRREIDPQTEPVLTVVLLAQASVAAGDAAGAEQALRRAISTRPDQVVLLDLLGKQLERQGPSRLQEAIGYYRAARSQRRHLGIALSTALVRAGQVEEAAGIRRDLVRQEPNNPALWMYLGLALHDQKDYSAADAAFLQAIALQPDFAEAHGNLGLSLYSQRKYAEAEEACRRASELKPNLAQAYSGVGVCLAAQQKYALAEVAHRKAIALEPDIPEGHFHLGYALSMQQKHSAAEAAYRQAIALKPNFPEALCNLGDCLDTQQKHGEAEAACRKAIALKPDFVEAYINLGNALVGQSRHSEAVDQFRQALVLEPRSALAASRLRITLVAQGRWEEAQLSWRQALQANPPQLEAWAGYPELCLFLGQEDEYRRVRKAMLARFATTTDQFVAERTGRACLLRPDPEDELRTAFALVERAAAPGPPQNAWARPYFLFAKGLADYRRGRLDSAISLMEREASGVLGPAPRLVLAMARYRHGQSNDARKSFALAVLAFDWNTANVDNSDAWMMHVLRREAEATVLPDLPAFLRGDYRPRQNGERLALRAAQLAIGEFEGLHHSAARLRCDALAEPSLAAAVPGGARYNAARAAVRVACGQARDTDRLDDKECALWRRRALEWLLQDLAWWGNALDNGNTQQNDYLRWLMHSWQTDSNLAGVRAANALARLPDEERKQWEKFWSDVDALLRRASGPR
jgi:serine/threonine-protein kinase